VSKDEKAALILTAEQTTKDPGAYLQDRLQAFKDARVSEISKGGRRINGLNAFRGFYLVQPQAEQAQAADAGQDMNVNIDCIQKDGFIYTFMGMSSKTDYPSFENTIERTVRSFQQLNDPKRLAAQPRRIVVRKPGAAQTLREFLVSQNVPPDRWKKVEFLNSIALDGKVERGQLIKIMN